MIDYEKYKSWIPIAERRKAYGEIGKDYFCKEIGMPVNFKGDNEIICTISTQDVDRESEVVIQKGINSGNFMKMRGVFFDHNFDGLQLGGADWVQQSKDKKSTLMKWKLAKNASEMHRAIYEIMKCGGYQSYSMSFLSKNPTAPTREEIADNPTWKSAKNVHRNIEMLEASLVGIPANVNSTEVVSSLEKKGFKDETIEFVQKLFIVERKIEPEIEKVEQIKMEQIKNMFAKAILSKLKKDPIHIKPSHVGEFTAYCGGKVDEACIRRGLASSDPHVREMANFARNAEGWKH